MPIIASPEFNSADTIEAFSEHWADLNVADVDSILRSAHDAQRTLLRLGVNHLTVDTDKERTMLHYAAAYGDETTVDLLASAGLQDLDIEAKNKNGETALEIL
ncbi:hypothetical protein QBC36DRAFT_311119 [Triangularia setosa]|uniref:Ankyrin repeat domain-containing protein n=1 Tax=Triangularia setosa TaxID=2587417 RepID=A0AAN7A7Q8_9PEZI|nr:hypothetical protein QBC36DRAFT_311119 [Podospora setosa]